VLGVAVVTTQVLAVVALARAFEVQITTVHAAHRGPSDAQLISLRPRLRRLVGYRSFQIVQQERRRCGWQSEQAFTLPGGRLLHVVPKGVREQALAMQVRLLEGPRELVDTDVRLQNRGVMLFALDPDPELPGAIIIMLKAEE
jgi:hypothetical protein